MSTRYQPTIFKRNRSFLFWEILYAVAAFILVMICSAGLHAVDTDLEIRNFRHGNGLIDANVNCIFKDKDGFIWLGTPSDVQRYDGIKNMRYEFSSGFGGQVNSIFQDSSGRILVATGKGIGMLQHLDQSITQIYPEIQTSVIAIEESGKDLIVITKESICHIGPNHKVAAINNTNRYVAVEKDKNEDIYLLAMDGVGIVDGDTVRHYDNTGIGSNFTSMADMGDFLLIGTDGKGLYKFDKKTRCFSHYHNIGNNHISEVAANQKIIVAATVGEGLFIFPNKNPEEICFIDYRPNKDGAHLAYNHVKSIFVDNLNIIWLSYYRNVGFDFIQFKNKAFSVFSNDGEIPVDLEYLTIFISDPVRLFATYNGLYSINATGTTAYHSFTEFSAKSNLSIKSYLQHGDNILIGTTAGLYVYQPYEDKVIPYYGYPQLDDTVIYMMAKNQDGAILIASDKGLYVLDTDGSIDHYTSANSKLQSDHITYVYSDSKDTTWVATDRAIQIFDSQKRDFSPTAAAFNDLLPLSYMNNEVDSNRMLMIKDRKNAFLMERDGKDKRGICTLEDADFLGLFIEKVLQDREHNYWFIGSRGVVKGNPTLSDYTLFSSTEGLVEPYSNDGQIHNDTLWIATPKGVLITNTNATLQSPPTKITDIIVNGESRIGDYMDSSGKAPVLSFPEDASNIIFEFATLSFDLPDRMIYEYKLEGFEDKWQILRGKNNVAFRNLPPGEYKFVVRKQMDNSSRAEITFRIGKRLSWSIILLLISIAVILIIATATFVRSRRYKNEVNTPRVSDYEASELQPYTTSEEMTATPDKDKISDETAIPAKDHGKYRFNRLKDETADGVILNLRKYMETEKPYLNPNLKLINVAEKLEVSPQVLSQVMNTCLNIRFNDYVNQMRIDRFKESVVSVDLSKYTLQSLARDCGFSSYSTFFRAFKDLTGQTPNDYIKSVSNGVK